LTEQPSGVFGICREVNSSFTKTLGENAIYGYQTANFSILFDRGIKSLAENGKKMLPNQRHIEPDISSPRLSVSQKVVSELKVAIAPYSKDWAVINKPDTPNPQKFNTAVRLGSRAITDGIRAVLRVGALLLIRPLSIEI
jgi:hypothetical protein